MGAAGRSPASGAARRMPSSTPWAMPRDGSSGVDGTFQVSILPACSSNRQMSVNVPPESTPTRHRDMPLALFQVAPAGMLVGWLVLFQARQPIGIETHPKRRLLRLFETAASRRRGRHSQGHNSTTAWWLAELLPCRRRALYPSPGYREGTTQPRSP